MKKKKNKYKKAANSNSITTPKEIISKAEKLLKEEGVITGFLQALSYADKGSIRNTQDYQDLILRLTKLTDEKNLWKDLISKASSDHLKHLPLLLKPREMEENKYRFIHDLCCERLWKDRNLKGIRLIHDNASKAWGDSSSFINQHKALFTDGSQANLSEINISKTVSSIATYVRTYFIGEDKHKRLEIFQNLIDEMKFQITAKRQSLYKDNFDLFFEHEVSATSKVIEVIDDGGPDIILAPLHSLKFEDDSHYNERAFIEWVSQNKETLDNFYGFTDDLSYFSFLTYPQGGWRNWYKKVMQNKKMSISPKALARLNICEFEECESNELFDWAKKKFSAEDFCTFQKEIAKILNERIDQVFFVREYLRDIENSRRNQYASALKDLLCWFYLRESHHALSEKEYDKHFKKALSYCQLLDLQKKLIFYNDRKKEAFKYLRYLTKTHKKAITTLEKGDEIAPLEELRKLAESSLTYPELSLWEEDSGRPLRMRWINYVSLFFKKDFPEFQPFSEKIQEIIDEVKSCPCTGCTKHLLAGIITIAKKLDLNPKVSLEDEMNELTPKPKKSNRPIESYLKDQEDPFDTLGILTNATKKEVIQTVMIKMREDVKNLPRYRQAQMDLLDSNKRALHHFFGHYDIKPLGAINETQLN